MAAAPETRSSAEIANDLRDWANAAMTKVRDLKGWNKTRAIEEADIVWNTWKRIANGTWAKGSGPGTGAPKQPTLDKMLDAWFGGTRHYEFEKQRVYRIMGWSLIPSGERPAIDPSLDRIARLLSSPLISDARKRRIRLRLDSVFLDDRAEAIAEGEYVLEERP